MGLDSPKEKSMNKNKVRWTVSKRRLALSILILVTFAIVIVGPISASANADIVESDSPQFENPSTEFSYCRCNFENYYYDVKDRCNGEDFLYTGTFYSNSGMCKADSNCYAPQNGTPNWVDCSECGSTNYGTGLFGDTLEWRFEYQCVSQLPNRPSIYEPIWD